MTVLDYSNWRPSSPQALKDHGVTGVVLYIKPQHFGWPKAVKPWELSDLRNHGIEVAFNYENNPGDWRGGYQAGVTNGHEAAQAMAELGQPASVPVYVSYDQEIQPYEFSHAAEYHRGFRDGCQHPLGVYGEGALIEALGTRWGWESESTSFPGNQSPTPHTVLVQHFGAQLPGFAGSYDTNTIVKADWGQIPRPSAPTPPKPEKVHPMFRPALDLHVAAMLALNDTAYAVQPDGSMFCVGPHSVRGMNGHKDFVGREAAQLVPPNAAEHAAGKLVTIVATSGERYALPTTFVPA